MSSTKARFVVFFFLSLVFAAAGQYLAGAYSSDLHWADEGSHYINGLLIHDYIARGLPQNPVHYAISYYENYPKVAIGHWPPFFYPIEAALFFVTGPSTAAALFLQALLGAILAGAVATVVARFHGWIAGVVAALLVLAAPQVFISMLGVMLDIPLALAAFLATLCWAKYLDSEDWRWSAGFSLCAAAAILTKGNGFFLALLPPLSLVFARRPELLKRWSFWLPVPIVGLLTIPWYVVTYKIAADGFNYAWGLDFTVKAIRVYGGILFLLVGIPGFVVAAAGAVRIARRREQGWEMSFGIAALSAAVAGFAYHCLVPVALEPRYLVPIVPDMVVIAFFALRWHLPLRYRTAAAASAIFLVLAAEVSFVAKPDLGLARAARIVESNAVKSPFVLIGSTPGGEGALTAEIATDDRSRQQYVLRGFQVLGSGNFMGTRYTPRFAKTEGMKQWIEANHIGWVVLDTSPASLKWGHNRQLRQLLDAKPRGWQCVAALQNRQGLVLIYRVLAGFSGPVNVPHLLPQLIPAKVIGQYHPH